MSKLYDILLIFLILFSLFCIICIILSLFEIYVKLKERTSVKIQPFKEETNSEIYTHNRELIINPQFIEIKVKK